MIRTLMDYLLCHHPTTNPAWHLGGMEGSCNSQTKLCLGWVQGVISYPGNLWCIIPHKRILHNIMYTVSWVYNVCRMWWGHWGVADVCMCVNVTDAILWQGHHDRVMQLNWLYFCGICQMMPLKVWPNTAPGCNHQSICTPQLQPLCSAAQVPNVLHRKDEGSGKPCAVIEAL